MKRNIEKRRAKTGSQIPEDPKVFAWRRRGRFVVAILILVISWIAAPAFVGMLVEQHVSANDSALTGNSNSLITPFNAMFNSVAAIIPPSPPCDPAGLDPSFGTGGKVVTPVGSGDDNAYAMAIDPGGRTVVAGRSHNGANFDFALARYNLNGTLDTSFHGNGKVVTSIGGGDDSAFSVAVQADRRIVAAGRSINGGNSDFALVRYFIDGSLDFTFNGTGKVVTPIGSGEDFGVSVAIQGDGRIVVAGYSHNGVDYDIALVRYNVDGTLDTTFNGTGKVVTPIGGGNDQAFSVAIQTDGRIVVAGQSASAAQATDFALVRYNTDGTLDTSFNGTGMVVTPIGSQEDVAWTVATQTDGRIVAAGFSNNGSNLDFALARYNTNGTLDTTFNGTGKVVTPIGSGDEVAWSVKIQADGRILAGGYSHNGSNPDFALARYNTDGTLDTTFNGTGKVVTPIGNGDDTGRGVGIQADGRIVAAGYSSNGLNTDFALIRYGDCGPTPLAPRAYVTNRFTNNVSVIDTGTDTLVTNITVGPTPYGIAVTPGSRRVYVTNQGSNSVSVIRTATNSVVANIPVGSGPIAVAITPDGTRAYVVNQASNNVSVIDTATNTVIGSPIPVGLVPTGIAIGNTSNGTRAYVANGNPGTVSVIRTDTNAVVATVPTAFGSDGLDITPNGDRVYVPNFTGGNVTVINTATNTVVTTLNVGGTPRYVNITPDGSLAYVSNGFTSPVIATASNTVVGTVNGVTSWDVAFIPNGSRAYVADGNLSNVTSVDMTTRTVLNTIALGGGVNAEGVAIAPLVTLRSTVRGDFDDDGKTDLSVFRPSEGNWYLNRSTAGFAALHWGISTDTPVPGDYDGDGKTDIAVFRPTATVGQPDFYVLNSNGFTASGFEWGTTGDIPVVGNYDGDVKSDIAIWRPSDLRWYIRNSATNTARVDSFGSPGDIPLVMDYDGDGRSNLAVFRPGENTWYLARSTGTPATNFEALPFGTAGDKLVPADYDGDGKDDVAVYRPSTGTWYILRSSNRAVDYIPFGNSTDIPVPGDYDGDGKYDLAIFRNGEWWVQRSTSGLLVANYGLSTDTPIPAKYIP